MPPCKLYASIEVKDAHIFYNERAAHGTDRLVRAAVEKQYILFYDGTRVFQVEFTRRCDSIVHCKHSIPSHPGLPVAMHSCGEWFSRAAVRRMFLGLSKDCCSLDKLSYCGRAGLAQVKGNRSSWLL